MMYEKTVKAFVYDALKNAKDGEVSIAFDTLVNIYTMAKQSNLKRLDDGILESGVINFIPFVEVEEIFDIDEQYRLLFDVLYHGTAGITAITAVVIDKYKNEDAVVVFTFG